MPPAPKHRAELERLLARGEWVEAKELAAAVLARNPRDGEAWLATGRCAIALGRLRVAEDALAKAAADRALAGDHRVPFFRAVAEHYLGRSSAAIDRLRALIAAGAPNSVDAHCFLVDILHRTGRREEMRALVAAGGPWLADLRGRVLAARARAADDRAAAAAELESIARGAGDPGARRNAGFEAATLLDALGEYRRAWDLAGFLHQSTTAPFDDYAFREDIALQRQLVGRGKPWFEVRVPPVEGIALVAGMPRSGTTLLEQMLDRHSEVAGIGEYEGIPALGNALQHLGAWPRGIGMLPAEQCAQLQRLYLNDARTPDVAGKRWLVDKSLHTWRLLPAVAALLPGARILHMARDPRDTAVSLHLSNFNGRTFAWTRTPELIRLVMEAEREHTLPAMQALGLAHEAIVYEDLVEDPAGHAARVCALLGVAVEPAMLAPEANTRTVLTLSHEQVRRPINKGSIGRWQNYPWAFDGSWDALVAGHQARRAKM
jgi:tetratricopeptide (TPR) repeat protein